MRIKSLHITGFKSLRDVTWEPGALNVIIGPNGSGKSNLLTALELLSHSASGGLDRFVKHHRGMRDLLWDGLDEFISFDMKVGEWFNQKTSDFGRYVVSLSELFKKSTDYMIETESLAMWQETDLSYTDEEIVNNIFTRDRNKIKYSGIDTDVVDPLFQEIFKNKESFISLISIPNEKTIDTYRLKLFMVEWSVYLQIDVSRDADLRRPVVSSYEKKVIEDGSNLINVLHTLYTEDRRFEAEINTAMQAAFGSDFEKLVFPPAADQRVQLRIRWKSLKREQSLGDISDGTLRFLFLMTVLAAPDPAPLIAIDEPETGLHPSMFPIIAEYAAQAAKKTQVVFTTHSPQFLDACGPFLPTVTVTGWKNGETTLKNLDGELLKQWLADYSLGKMFESGDLEALA